MVNRLLVVGALALVSSANAATEEPIAWDSERVTALVESLHRGVHGLRDEIRSTSRTIGSTQSQAHFRLLDNLRLIERETRYLHNLLESGAGRDETRPVYARIGVLRRDCEEEMERLYLRSPALERIRRARDLVREIDPYYGVDSNVGEHERVLERH